MCLCGLMSDGTVAAVPACKIWALNPEPESGFTNHKRAQSAGARPMNVSLNNDSRKQVLSG